jgi:hypothetical protein
MSKEDARRLIEQLLSTLADTQFYMELVDSLKAHIEAHPWATAFFIVGVMMMCNPVAIAGFGSLGPIAGK